MRLFISLGAMSLALAGCVAQAPPQYPVVPPVVAPPVVTAPAPSADGAARAAARDIVNREMAQRLPGRNASLYTDCVINSASTAELADIVARNATDPASTTSSVAAIVSRPETAQCIAKVTATA